MPRERSKQPTRTEQKILNVLWEHGPCTVRQVHEILGAAQETGYTTTLKMLQIMTDKGLVKRDESSRSHIYEASLPREQTQRQIVGDLMERVFGGAASSLVMRALQAKKTSHKELAEIRRILDEYEKDMK